MLAPPHADHTFPTRRVLSDVRRRPRRRGTTVIGVEFTSHVAPHRGIRTLDAIAAILDQVRDVRVEVRTDPGGFFPSPFDEEAEIRQALEGLVARGSVTLTDATQDAVEWFGGLDLLILPAPTAGAVDLLHTCGDVGLDALVPAALPDFGAVKGTFTYDQRRGICDPRSVARAVAVALDLEVIADVPVRRQYQRRNLEALAA